MERAEVYFLDAKIALARQKIRLGIHHEKLFRFRRGTAARISAWGERLAESQAVFIAKALFRLAILVSPLDWEAARGLALIANRKGKYEEAINWLRAAIASVPEDPYTRLNLAADLIFKEDGKWTQESRMHAKVAIFHGGPSTKDRFRLLLSNTPTREELTKEFNDVLFEQAKQEREAWQSRRRIILKPERFGQVMHFEFRE